MIARPGFWSHAVARIAAPAAAGSTPPLTKPKKRPWFWTTVAGEPKASSSASTSRAGMGTSWRGRRNTSSASTASRVGAMGLNGAFAMKEPARRAASVVMAMRSRMRAFEAGLV
ncbi:MAG: hypothetical protein NVV57_08280 [Demequina sp.]|nr:hypothetical protein [Demequina sp.]